MMILFMGSPFLLGCACCLLSWIGLLRSPPPITCLLNCALRVLRSSINLIRCSYMIHVLSLFVLCRFHAAGAIRIFGLPASMAVGCRVVSERRSQLPS
ncbi:hypothetical protein V1509DRAFT_625436 [Lipomyces kononenkoae]